jgi:SAM-dependent methyltransferase
MIEFPVLSSGEQPVWDGEKFLVGGRSLRMLSYSTNPAGWDDDLTDLHEIEAGNGTHPIDVASRASAIKSIRDAGFTGQGSILEIGCSSGFLLHELKEAFPTAEIVGADIVVTPLERLGSALRAVPLIQMDLLCCPLDEGQFDVVVALNVLEHIEDDRLALRQMARLLKPGGTLILEVPQGPGLYDYYDAFLRHSRRYTKKELLDKIRDVGLTVHCSGAVGFVVFPSFYLVKKLNRLRYGVRGERTPNLEQMVRRQIKRTSTNRFLDFVFALESKLTALCRIAPGIRCTVTARKPGA